MDAIGVAIRSLSLAWEVINAYLELREVIREARRTIVPLQGTLASPLLTNACKNNPSSAVQGALVNIRRAAQDITDRANKIRSKARWQQIMFAKDYSAKLLNRVAYLQMRVGELQLLLHADTNVSVHGVRQQLEQQHRETLERLSRLEAAPSINSTSVREQLHEALVIAVERGDTAEATAIERVLAFLDGTPSTIGPGELQEMLRDLQGQISDAQENKSHNEAHMLEQFAKYLSLQDRSAGVSSVLGRTASVRRDLEPHLTCIICRDIYTDPVMLGSTGRTYCRECISAWLAGHNTSPHDNVDLTSRELVTNWDMRGLVEAYHARQNNGSSVPNPAPTHAEQAGASSTPGISSQPPGTQVRTTSLSEAGSSTANIPAPSSAAQARSRATSQPHTRTRPEVSSISLSDNESIWSEADEDLYPQPRRQSSDTPAPPPHYALQPIPGDIPALVAILSDNDHSTQAYAARALAKLADDHTGHQGAIVATGAIRPLVQLLSSRCVIVQDKAAWALRNLAYNHMGNKCAIAAAGAIAPLVQLLSSARADVQRSAARALCMLADGHEGNRDAIAAAGAIGPLVQLLNSNCTDVQHSAAWALGVLGVKHKRNQDAVAAAGAIEPLVQLLSSNCTDVQHHAAWALGALAVKHKRNQEAVGLAGAIRPLVQLLSSPCADVQAGAAGALARVVDFHSGNKRAAKRMGAREALKLLGDSSNPDVSRAAHEALIALSSGIVGGFVAGFNAGCAEERLKQRR